MVYLGEVVYAVDLRRRVFYIVFIEVRLGLFEEEDIVETTVYLREEEI